MVISVHHKHLDQLCKLLGLSKKLQSKKRPGHAEMEIPDKTSELGRWCSSTWSGTCQLTAHFDQCIVLKWKGLHTGVFRQ